MKTTVELLTTAERRALALWYDTASYKALKKLLKLERENTATKLIDIDPTDSVSIARHQGRADFAKQLHLKMKDNYQVHVRTEESNANRNKKKQKS